jgi:hypothetical protein
LLLAFAHAVHYAARQAGRQEAAPAEPVGALKECLDDGQEAYPHRR